ncbi:MAG: hypothetical protein K2P94_11085 [Rhodospirillaceae bacterium]|nr:hypothetical protein [Rhodospirillaceae bacterium]
MLNIRASLKTGIAALLIATMTFGVLAPVTAVAQDRDRHDNRGGRDHDRGYRGDRHDNRADREWRARAEWRGERHWGGPPRHVHVRPRPDYYRPSYLPRSRYYNHVHVHRPYGHAYPGFGFYYRDNDALRFLGLTALSLAVFSHLNETQQRAHEEAFIQATDAPIGEPIIWNEDGRTGSVTALRDGTTPDGRQCREFQQQVTIGGNDEDAYGTACLQPDGSWQVVND